MNSETRHCQNCKREFVIEPDDFGFYEQMKVSPPTWCPECRLVRRLTGSGYRILYKRKCDFTGDMVISTHHQDAPYTIYKQDVWWSDKWDPKSYGRAYDFSKPFFEQYNELLKEVPLPALYTEYTTMVESEYCNAAANLKNCYLCFKADNSENCAYLNTISQLKECVDVAFSDSNELSYESANINKCYHVLYSKNCDECQDIYFSEDLVGCSNCIGCVGLRKKNYHIFNEPYTKEAYEEKVKQFDFGSKKWVDKFKKEARERMLKFPRKEFHGRNTVRSSGEYLTNVKNVKNSYMVRNAENIRFSQLLKNGPAANAYDYTMFAMRAEWIYESCWVGIDVSQIKFGVWNYHAHDIEYCFGCHGTGNSFGCVGVRNNEYCILNKQYTKEEYQELLPRIKRHMAEVPYRDAKRREYRYGEFFPAELSPWAYNESNAQEWFPLTKEQALAQGFSWRDVDPKEYREATVEIPDHIKDVQDDILKGILKCDECGKNYQIIKMELDFYRRFQIPIPRTCPLCRDRARIKELNPMQLHSRTCAKCGKNIETTYSPDRPEIVYCEACYQKEIL